jgi:16S rRNA (guanine966-N2)-methyltransferase
MAKQTHPDNAKRGSNPNNGGVRIIAGQWRGRRIPVAAVAGLRPTPDRVRETLFNWLMPTLAGSYCLDLFAGSGVLGWEALSRGAAGVSFVERDRLAVKVLQAQQETLDTDVATIVCGEAETYLRGAPRAFDVVFLDPPYATELEPLLQQLWPAWLTPTGRVYVERDSERALDSLASLGRLSHRSHAGGVHYGLLERGLEP